MGKISAADMWEQVSEVAYEVLTDRQAEFIEDIEDRAKNGTLTPNQLDYLEKLYEKACRSDY